MKITEHTEISPLITLIDRVVQDKEAGWIVITVKREALKPVTNEAFIMAITPALQKADKIDIYFMGDKRIYITCNGGIKETYQQLRGVITSALVRPGVTQSVVLYNLPDADGEAIKQELQEYVRQNPGSDKSSAELKSGSSDVLGWDKDIDEQNMHSDSVSLLTATPEHINHFNEVRGQRPYRRVLQVLAVEDHAFYQKLIGEMVRNVRVPGCDSIAIDIADGLKSAWGLFLKKAHDIVFIDLKLTDGSGHALTKAIKEIDPTTVAIIVTANSYEEEMVVAKQNNVDGFITKPYSKKQIMDCILQHTKTAKARR